MSPHKWDELVFNVDFNERDEDDASLVIASRSFATGSHAPDVGERVMLRDDEGNQCQGVVRVLREPIVLVEPIDGTFRHLERIDVRGLVPQRPSAGDDPPRRHADR